MLKITVFWYKNTIYNDIYTITLFAITSITMYGQFITYIAENITINGLYRKKKYHNMNLCPKNE